MTRRATERACGVVSNIKKSETGMLKVQSLSRRFGALVAVDGLSFEVAPGEVLGFLGPNGAGKSTTMKMITGFLTPSSGTATICGHDIQTDPVAAKRELGYLPEGAPAYGDMTVEQFLRFIARIREIPAGEIQQRIDTVIDSIQLQAVVHRPIEALSKGYKRRVGLAQAILHDPKVLILDEPTDGLDPNQKHEVRKLIRSMAKDKVIVVSTHILEEVPAVCTRAMLIAKGHALFDGTPEQLSAKSRYHQAVTVQLDAVDDAAEALRALDGAASVETGPRSVTVFPTPGASLIEPVNQLARERGWQTHSIFQEPGRLDDVFRSLTEAA